MGRVTSEPGIARATATARAEEWLQKLLPRTSEAKALRSLGLLCCERIRAGIALCGKGSRAPVRLPGIAAFIAMERAETLAVCRSIAMASRASRRGAMGCEGWKEVFGSVALSYARTGDSSTTAALLRAAAQLGLGHPWLAEAERFLLNQQNPTGSFGLFARELALLGNEGSPDAIYLSLSVEILWALAEVAALSSAT